MSEEGEVEGKKGSADEMSEGDEEVEDDNGKCACACM